MMRWIYEEIYAVTNDMIILQFRETFVRFLLFSMPFEKLKLSPRQQSREASYSIVCLYQIVLHNFVRFVKMVLIFVSNIMSSKTNISIHSSSVHVSYCLTEYLHTRRWSSIRTNIVCFLKYIAGELQYWPDLLKVVPALYQFTTTIFYLIPPIAVATSFRHMALHHLNVVL
jgi:hypothetical protein